ncbi:MAG TPA: hypothetical protein VHY30_02435 [Verrucomicrobiae bacterium]|jgi:hypothetical protein|nr:hypothetical protein [Verrucomicrobiae bacterium]
MTPEKAALIGVVAGGLITLLGTLLTGALNIWLQWLQSRWQLSNEAKKDLRQKQIAALQKCVQMIDFLIAAKNATLGEGGMNMWARIRQETLSDGALFPPELSDDYANVIQKVLLLDSLERSSEALDFATLERLRKGCVDYIHKKD